MTIWAAHAYMAEEIAEYLAEELAEQLAEERYPRFSGDVIIVSIF